MLRQAAREIRRNYREIMSTYEDIEEYCIIEWGLSPGQARRVAAYIDNL